LSTLLVTAEASSPLAALGAPLHIMPVGPEPVGPKTKGFLGSVATLLVFAGHAAGFEAARLDAALDPAHERAEALAASLDEVDALLVAGHGAAHGLALEASLKVAEMAGIPSAAFAWEEALHGRLHGLTPRSLLLLLAGGEAEATEAHRAREAMAARGCRIEVASPGDPAWDPAELGAGFRWFGPALILQWLAVLLAERRGLRPEEMRHGALSAALAIKLGTEP
jgi:glucosamine--fructose-6-phosphate aminotransferase (isomerizing)